MVHWSEGIGSEADDEIVQGEKKTAYNFSDLKEWLEVRKKVKGKQKVVKNKTEEKDSKKKVDSAIVKGKK